MNGPEISTIVSAIVAIGALIFSYLQSRARRYEIKKDYRNQLIKWYSDTVRILIHLKLLAKNDSKAFEQQKMNLLSSLSSQIEIGRFYFPNINKDDGFGESKPQAYRGYRNLALDFLVYSYDIFNRGNIEKYYEHLETLQREFTSIVFEILDPNEFIEEFQSISKKKYFKEWSVEEFLKNDPEKLPLILSGLEDTDYTK